MTRPDDPRLDWRGLVEWERLTGGWRPWRLPPIPVRVLGAGRLAERAQEAAGVRLDVMTDATTIALSLIGSDESSPVDICVDGELSARRPIRDGDQTVVVPLPAGVHRVELWLPQIDAVTVRGLLFENAAVLHGAAAQTSWVTYGSSITQCRGASGPSETWPALVARSLDWDLTCLGFGGEAHLDAIAATTIRDRQADIVSLCVGVNIQGGATLDRRTLLPSLAGFIDTVRAGHPRSPMLVIGPIASPQRERVPNQAGLSLSDVRDEVERTVEVLRTLGDEDVTYLDGRTLIGETEGELLDDGLHPTANGYRVIAQRVMPVLRGLGPTAERGTGIAS